MHRSSHAALLLPCEDGVSRRDVDMIVVPTNRPAPNLSFAISLAKGLSCPILLLCSGESRAARAVDVLASVEGAAVTVSSSTSHPLLRLPSQRPVTFLAQPYVDTGNKRNIALLAGRMLGWRRVLFLDDDIRQLSAEQVRLAAGAVGPRVPALGWVYSQFPDNSVACHALRASGQDQDVFLGAGALLVDVSGDVPFFPSIYNEDWLFWHEFVVRRELGLASTTVQQIEFNPFDDPWRARQEEFGDVLAEGLYNLIHDRRSVLVGCLPGYWEGVLDARSQLLVGIEKRLWARRKAHTDTWDGYDIAQVLRSVMTSRQTLESFTAQHLAEYTSLWRHDLFRWKSRLHHLPKLTRLSEALHHLGVSDIHHSPGS